MCKSIFDYINENLEENDKTVALDFVDYLSHQKMEFIKDNGYWKSKIYYLVKYNNKYVCFIAIKDPDEPNNAWTVWSEDMNSKYLGSFPIEDRLKEIAWKHVDECENCGSCSGGKQKVIFGRLFDNVCGCTFRFDNPTFNDLSVLKRITEIRKKEITDII